MKQAVLGCTSLLQTIFAQGTEFDHERTCCQASFEEKDPLELPIQCNSYTCGKRSGSNLVAHGCPMSTEIYFTHPRVPSPFLLSLEGWVPTPLTWVKKNLG